MKSSNLHSSIFRPHPPGVPGWLLSSNDSSWKVWDSALCGVASDGGEALALRWETQHLQEMGKVVSSFLKEQASSYTAPYTLHPTPYTLHPAP